jgi:hypothetical protein
MQARNLRASRYAIDNARRRARIDLLCVIYTPRKSQRSMLLPHDENISVFCAIMSMYASHDLHPAMRGCADPLRSNGRSMVNPPERDSLVRSRNVITDFRKATRELIACDFPDVALKTSRRSQRFSKSSLENDTMMLVSNYRSRVIAADHAR